MSRLAGFALPSPPIATRSFRFAFVRASGSRPSCDSGVTVQPSTLSRRAVLKIASICSAAIFASALDVPVADATAPKGAESVYDVEVVKDGKAKSLSFLKGKVTVFVNVASYCALTPQYEGLVALHNEFQPAGLEIVASPCDQFAHQEPGSNEEVCTFAREKFGARFLLLDKLRVNGAPGGVAPLYQILKAKSPNFTGSVSWNFEKFLVDCNGHVLRRYKPGVLPEEIRSDIEFAIKHPGRDLPSRKKPLLGVD